MLLSDVVAFPEQTSQRQISTSNTNTFSTLNLNTLNGLSIGGPGSTISSTGAMLSRQPSSAKDPKSRAKSREYLKQCLQEISYLTSASTLNPIPERPVSASSLHGPPRPRKAMPENVPPTFPNMEAQGTLTGAGAKRQKGLDKGSTGPKPGSRGMQLFEEPLMEREEEGTDAIHNGARQPFADKEANQEGTVEGLALDKESLVEDKREGGSEGSFSGGSGSSHSSSEEYQSSQSSTDEQLRDIADEEEREPVTAVYRPGVTNADDWDKLKEVGRIERDKRERERNGKHSTESTVLRDEQAQLQATSDRVQKLMRQNAVQGDEEDLASLTLPGDTDEEASRIAAEAAAESQMWKSKHVLRGHLDSVRAVAFDLANVSLYSASDDNTIKFWKIDDAVLKGSKSSQVANDIDPLMTLRGHTGAVTCLALSKSKRRLYSGSVDASIVVWKLLDGKQVEPYPPFDKSMELARLVGHTQAVWDVCLLPARDDDEGYLASASADGTVKLWSTQDAQGSVGGRLLLSFDYFGLEPSAEKQREREAMLEEKGTLPVPTSVATCMSDLRRCVVSYSNAVVKLFEVQTGKEVMQFASDNHYGELLGFLIGLKRQTDTAHRVDGTEGTQVNKVITHPTLPILVSGHENNFIQFFDIDTGACTLSMIGHLDSVTSLDVDPSGLTLVSGGHDCSVRFWDIVNSATDPTGGRTGREDKAQGSEESAAVCVQEITAHRKKSGEGVLFVKYHPSAPWFCSTGADGVIRIYG